MQFARDEHRCTDLCTLRGSVCPVAGDNSPELPDSILLENNKEDEPVVGLCHWCLYFLTSASLSGDETRYIEK